MRFFPKIVIDKYIKIVFYRNPLLSLIPFQVEILESSSKFIRQNIAYPNL